MARRGGRGGRSSRGRSSRGRSKSKSRGRSSSRKSSKRKSSTSSRRSTSRGRTSSKGRATKRTTRTKTTRSAPARRAATRTSRATPRRVRRTVVRRKITRSFPRPRLTGGRIAQKPQTVRNIRTTPNRMVRSVFNQQKAANIAGAPVTVTFASGQKQTMRLSTAAIRAYQNQGLKVSPVTQTMTGFNPMQTVFNMFKPTQTAYASPQIPRIQNKTPAWSSNPPPQLHVSTPAHVKPNTRTNSNFGGLGANPWNPIEGITGLFGMPPQEKPQSQYLPQQQNTQSTGYPTYTAMSAGQYQEQAFNESPQGFQTSMSGDSSFNAGDTIKNLMQNQYVIYGGLAVGALVILKIVMGGGKQVVYR